MEYQTSLQSMKNEIIKELRNESQRIVDKLNITQRSIDTQNSTITILSEELKTVKKEMYIYAKQKQHIDTISETLQSLIQYNQMINKTNENILGNNTEMPNEIEDNSTFNENDDNIYYNDLNDIADNSLSNETTIKTELKNPFEEHIYESLEKESNFDIEENSKNPISKSVSSGERPLLVNQYLAAKDHHECIYCSKRFRHSSALNIHVKLHTGENLFKCDICSKQFTSSTDLKRHLRTHTGEKPFGCTQCTKTFVHSSHLKEHLRLHTGEKPYECEQCLKRFKQSSGLQYHLKTHRRNANYNLNVTGDN